MFDNRELSILKEGLGLKINQDKAMAFQCNDPELVESQDIKVAEGHILMEKVDSLITEQEHQEI